MDFRPTRASTPPRPKRRTNAIANVSSTTLSSTTSSTQPLSSLTPDNISVIDDIIDRVPDATTFLAVFKAYNDVLAERGIDAGEDVIYYGFLLKLGVVKGKDWGERWEMVKQTLLNGRHETKNASWTELPAEPDHSFVSASSVTTEENGALDTPRPPQRTLPGRVTVTSGPIARSEPRPSSKYTSSHKPSPLNHRMTPVTPAEQRPMTRMPPLPSLQISPSSDSELSYVSKARDDPQEDESEGDDDHDYPFSGKPPSYRTFPPEPRLPVPSKPGSRVKIPSPPRPSSSKGRIERPTRLPIEKDERGVNGHNFWEVNDMERDADDFRQIVLLRRYWDVWRNGVNWITTTSHQVDAARDHIILRSAFQDWVFSLNRLRDLSRRVDYVSGLRLLRSAFHTWNQNLEDRKRRELREGVKRRVALIRQSIDSRLKADTFKRWLFSIRAFRMERIREENLKREILFRWFSRLENVLKMSDGLAEYQQRRERFTLEKSLDVWKRRIDLKVGERIITYVVTRRTLRDTLSSWRISTDLHHQARLFDAASLRKNMLTRWKQKQTALKALTRRANTHIHRRDDLLLRAVLRVWVARERGELIERVKRTRLGMGVFQAWRDRLFAVSQLNSIADAVLVQRRDSMLSNFYNVWRTRSLAQNTALTVAQEHYTRQLLHHALELWHKQRQAHLRRVKQARITRRWFLKRYCWTRWRLAQEERARERRLNEWKSEMLKKYVQRWRAIAQRQRQHNSLGELLQAEFNQRSKQRSLQKWTSRIVHLREVQREADQRASLVLKRDVLAKWVTFYQRCKDNEGLMQSVLDVNREASLRRVWSHWQQATRTSTYRRERLLRKEEEMRFALLSGAWEHWRDRFEESRLHDIESDVRRQLLANLLFRTFRIWESKAYSIPAVRIYAQNTKAKYLRKWLQALPGARLESKGREKERTNVQGRFFRKWLTVYRAKMNLKAVARARYLRLPTATPSPRMSVTPRSLGTRGLAPITPRPPVVAAPPTHRLSREERTRDVGRRPTRSPSPSKITRPLSAVVRSSAAAERDAFKSGKPSVKEHSSDATQSDQPHPRSKVLVTPPAPLGRRSFLSHETSSAPGSTAGDEQDRDKTGPRARPLLKRLINPMAIPGWPSPVSKSAINGNSVPEGAPSNPRGRLSLELMGRIGPTTEHGT